MTFATNNYYVPKSGSIQQAIDAVPAGTIVNVQAGGHYSDYDVDDNLLTIAFQNGPTLSMTAGTLAPNLITLSVNGGPQGNTRIEFQAGHAAAVSEMQQVDVVIAGLPTGSFAPDSIVAHTGTGKNAVIEVDADMELPAVLIADAAGATLQGGGGPTVEMGGGSNTILQGGTGPSLLLAGPGSAQAVGGSGAAVLVGGGFQLPQGAPLEATLFGVLETWTAAFPSFAAQVAGLED